MEREARGRGWCGVVELEGKRREERCFCKEQILRFRGTEALENCKEHLNRCFFFINRHSKKQNIPQLPLDAQTPHCCTKARWQTARLSRVQPKKTPSSPHHSSSFIIRNSLP